MSETLTAEELASHLNDEIHQEIVRRCALEEYPRDRSAATTVLARYSSLLLQMRDALREARPLIQSWGYDAPSPDDSREADAKVEAALAAADALLPAKISA